MSLNNTIKDLSSKGRLKEIINNLKVNRDANSREYDDYSVAKYAAYNHAIRVLEEYAKEVD